MPNIQEYIAKIAQKLLKKRGCPKEIKDVRETPVTPIPGVSDCDIAKIIQALEKSKTRDEAYSILDAAAARIPGFKCVSNTVFVKDDFQFQCTRKSNADRTDFEAMKRAYPHLESVRKIDIGSSGMTVVFSIFKSMKTIRIPHIPEYTAKVVQDLEKSKTKEEVYNVLDAAAYNVPGIDDASTESAREVIRRLALDSKFFAEFQCAEKSLAGKADFESMKIAYPHLESVRKIDVGDSGVTVVLSIYDLDELEELEDK